MINVSPKHFPDNNKVMLLSGGVDSIAAAHWLSNNYYKSFSAVIHFNHNIQAANAKMEKNVIKFCNYFGMSLHIIKNETHKSTSEHILREWRLGELSKFCERHGVSFNFITAHHLNDAVESYMDNCLKGTPEYLPISWKTDFVDGYTVWHPFLKTRKKYFEEHVDKNDLRKYIVEDPSNKNTKYKRNWIRNDLLPLIDERNLGLESVVFRKFYQNS